MEMYVSLRNDCEHLNMYNGVNVGAGDKDSRRFSQGVKRVI